VHVVAVELVEVDEMAMDKQVCDVDGIEGRGWGACGGSGIG
jgi:hypothetical protein